MTELKLPHTRLRPNIDVQVDVHVTPNPRVAVAEPVVRFAPPIAVAAPAPAPAPLMRDGQTLIEIGPTMPRWAKQQLNEWDTWRERNGIPDEYQKLVKPDK